MWLTYEPPMSSHVRFTMIYHRYQVALFRPHLVLVIKNNVGKYCQRGPYKGMFVERETLKRDYDLHTIAKNRTDVCMVKGS